MNTDHNFVECLKPAAFRQLVDKMAGISPEQRVLLDAKKAEQEARIDALAKQAIGKLTSEEADALNEYWTRDC